MRKLIASVIALGLLGCGPEASQPTSPAGSRGQVAFAITGAPSEIASVVATLSRAGQTDRVLTLAIDDSTRSAAGTLDDALAGIWHLRVDALDASNVVRYRGEADVDVVAGGSVMVDLELLPITGSITIRVRWGLPPVTYSSAYHTDFAHGVGPEWNVALLDTTPSGRVFLGSFEQNEPARVTLTDLPPHESIRVTLHLFIILSWDGSQVLEPSGGLVGPDIWTARVDGGPLLQRTTFSNVSWLEFPQAFPGNVGASNPFQSGAAERNSLGYVWVQWPADAVYDLHYDFVHTGDALTLDFHSELVPNDAEYWGIESLEVQVGHR